MGSAHLPDLQVGFWGEFSLDGLGPGKTHTNFSSVSQGHCLVRGENTPRVPPGMDPGPE